jgi:hypothetical protein
LDADPTFGVFSFEPLEFSGQVEQKAQRTARCRQPIQRRYQLLRTQALSRFDGERFTAESDHRSPPLPER